MTILWVIHKQRHFIFCDFSMPSQSSFEICSKNPFLTHIQLPLRTDDKFYFCKKQHHSLNNSQQNIVVSFRFPDRLLKKAIEPNASQHNMGLCNSNSKRNGISRIQKVYSPRFGMSKRSSCFNRKVEITLYQLEICLRNENTDACSVK